MKDILSNLKPTPGSTHSTKRLGRGVGSGLGKTSGRGTKGQLSRSGGAPRPGFEGGQLPLFQRIPKRGFTNIRKKYYQIVSLSSLNELTETDIDVKVLHSAGIVRHLDSVKILGNGELTKKVNLIDKDILVSASAKKAIEALGGSVFEKKA